MPNYTKPTMKKKPVKKGTTTKRAMKEKMDKRSYGFKPTPTRKKK